MAEDIGAGDLTAALIPPAREGRATVITREDAVICGFPYVTETFHQIDPRVSIKWDLQEGDSAMADQALFTVEGPARALLTGERTALNFLQLLSATATAARAYGQLLRGTNCKLLDTRKTIPGLRTAQKYAVRVGGGFNHRMGLFDGILIKENHIMAAGSILKAVSAAKAQAEAQTQAQLTQAPRKVPIEVEVETLDQLEQAIAAAADIALLDNFSLPLMREAVALNAASSNPLKLEASGGITLDGIREIAETGVDFISVGSITKNIRAADLSMRFEWRD